MLKVQEVVQCAGPIDKNPGGVALLVCRTCLNMIERVFGFDFVVVSRV